MNEETNRQLRDMKVRLRTMGVFSNGVWQKAEGVWMNTTDYIARVYLNGKELIVGPREFVDLGTCSPEDVELEIIRKNISTLPKLRKKPSNPSPPSQAFARMQSAFRNYQITIRDGRPHAVPYPDPAEWPPPADVNILPQANNNV